MPRPVLLLVLLAAGCAGIESEIRRAELDESIRDLLHGQDRGVWGYRANIEALVTDIDPLTRQYAYVAPAHVSQYRVERAARGLGGTRIEGAAGLAAVTDKLLFLLSADPTPAVRGTACRQLGRILERLPPGGADPLPTDPRSDDRINEVAYDLAAFGRAIGAGERVTHGQVVERMEALAQERPTNFMGAVQMVRTLTAYPIGGAGPGPITATLERVGPAMIRDCILVVLREMACGHAAARTDPDPAPLVRLEAADVLASLAPANVRDAVLVRLRNPLDPEEQVPEIRIALLAHLGRVGGPDAFAVALVRLEDIDPNVRYAAAEALSRMTGATPGTTPDAWRAWRDAHPAWQAPAPAEQEGF